jgi:hypothetical protein
MFPLHYRIALPRPYNRRITMFEVRLTDTKSGELWMQDVPVTQSEIQLLVLPDREYTLCVRELTGVGRYSARYTSCWRARHRHHWEQDACKILSSEWWTEPEPISCTIDATQGSPVWTEARHLNITVLRIEVQP